MSGFWRRPVARWAVPVSIAAVAVAVTGTGVLGMMTASADESLPPRSAAQLLVDLQTARLEALSGTVVHKADVGMPELPSVGGAGSSDLTSLVSGSHTLRIWYAGPSKVRLALLGSLGESDVIRNGRDLWFWSSEENSATHRRLPTDGRELRSPSLDELDGITGITPQEAADRALRAVDPTTRVAVEGTATVAGRGAYELVLNPRDAASLVGEVRIAVDAEQKVPLRLQVFARGADEPAYEVGFTKVSFARPADAQFRFTPPPGVKVEEEAAEAPPESALDSRAADAGAEAGRQGLAEARAGERPVLVGKGWAAVAQARLPATLAQMEGLGGEGGDGSIDAQLSGVLQALPRVSGTWGSGRLLTSRLFSVLVTHDGRVLAGAVTPSRLYEVAAQPMPGAGAGAGAGAGERDGDGETGR